MTLPEKTRAAALLKKLPSSALAVLAASAISCAMTPASVLAEETVVEDGNAFPIISLEGIDSGCVDQGEGISLLAGDVEAAGDSAYSLVVVDANGDAPDFIDGAWNLTGGTYTASGRSQSSEGLRITGDVTLNLGDATIDHSFPKPDRSTAVDDVARYAPAISVESGTAQINLSGANAAIGAPGYAGVFVAPGATLIIAGDGSLDAIGGDACPDISYYLDGTWLNGVPLPGAFGAGENQRGYFTGGAGIGGNGIWVKLSNPGNPNLCEEIPGSSSNFGTVRIDGGIISATGGDTSDRVQFGAGAGIGAGGGTGIATPVDTVWSLNHPFSGTVEINDGIVVATGGESISWSKEGGGAGIGTGGLAGNRYYTNNNVEIFINGGQVTAVAKSYGAGIGGGGNVPSGLITITGGSVTANGGGEAPGSGEPWGGAGIGGGDGDWNYVWFIDISGGTIVATGAGDAAGIGVGNDGWSYGDIYLRGSADVTAYGGSGRNGGNGIDADKVHLWDQASVRAYASGSGKGIVYGSDFDMSGITSLWVQTEDPSGPVISNLNGIAYSSPSTYLVTDWSYLTDSPNPATAYGWLDLPSGKLEGDKRFSYEWTDAGLTIDGNLIPLSAGSHPTGGSWAALYDEPYEVAYGVEHYQEQLDGAYKLAETEFPLYGKIGATVTATAKEYAHYHVNDAVSVLSGTVVFPIVENGEPKLLTLKVYYDLDEVTLSYDLNRGIGAEGVDYAPEITEYGKSLAAKPAPVKSGCTFLGWQDGESLYQPGDAVTLTANVTLTAKWGEDPPSRPQSSGGDDPSSPQGSPIEPGDGDSRSGRIVKGLTRLAQTGDAVPCRLIGAMSVMLGGAFALALAARRKRGCESVGAAKRDGRGSRG